jgi:hypothetical protein
MYKDDNKKKAITEKQPPGCLKSNLKSKLKNPSVLTNHSMKKDLMNFKRFYQNQNKYGQLHGHVDL